MERERVNPITLKNEETGEEYTLEFNRTTIMAAERMGFRIKTFEETPMTSFGILWYCAFKMHHPDMTPMKADKMLDQIDKEMREKLFPRLYDLYLAGAESLSDQNPKVTVIL